MNLFISKKTMRKKDFAIIKGANPHPSYKSFRAPLEAKTHHQSLYRTPRGWFLSIFIDGARRIGEVSVTTAQKWLDESGFKFQTGW